MIRQSTPLCIDMDGTLVRTDTLYECLISLIREKILYLIFIPFWLMRGKAYTKSRLAKHSSLKYEYLPYETNLIKWITQEHNSGRKIILATGADEIIAKGVANHLKIFHEVIGSNGVVNLSGLTKLRELEQRYGKNNFDYVGNSRKDIEIWHNARLSIVVGTIKFINKIMRKEGISFDRIFIRNRFTAKDIFVTIRVNQWVKNLLLFVPLVTAHLINEIFLLKTLIVAFFAFGFTSSSIYIINDLMDLEYDRQHDRKQFRSLSSGTVPIYIGVMMVPLFMISGLSLSYLISSKYFTAVMLYILLTLIYSLWLKKVVLADVIVLAILYTSRIIAGAIAINVVLSTWLMMFSIFIFLSLALSKRHSELYYLRGKDKIMAAGRGYKAIDLEQVSSFGSASGYISILIFALYINSAEVGKLYAHPTRLLLICPLLIYWISRIWLLSNRGEMPDDPVLFAVKDPVSYLVGGGIGLILWIATVA